MEGRCRSRRAPTPLSPLGSWDGVDNLTRSKAESVSDEKDHGELSDVVAAFDETDVNGGDADLFGELFLGPAALLAESCCWSLRSVLNPIVIGIQLMAWMFFSSLFTFGGSAVAAELGALRAGSALLVALLITALLSLVQAFNGDFFIDQVLGAAIQYPQPMWLSEEGNSLLRFVGREAGYVQSI